MTKHNHMFPYYLAASANFMAAFGGGMILGKGIGILDSTYLPKGDSLLAFFVGTVFGLAFYQFFPKKWSKTLSYFFSFGGAATSLLLFLYFSAFSVEQKIAGPAALGFFLLLSIRFGFWFYSRVFRAANAAGLEQKIAWVEFGYYSGMISGLVIWQVVGIELMLLSALVLDSFLQFSSGMLDLLTNQIKFKSELAKKSVTAQPVSSQAISYLPSSIPSYWGWRLSIAIVLLTIGTQVLTFNLAHQVPEQLGYYILGFFYFGVSIAALCCGRGKVKLVRSNCNEQYSRADIHFKFYGHDYFLSFTNLSFIALFCVFLAAILVSQHSISTIFNASTSITMLASVTLAAFFYEVLALCLMDRIGLEEKENLGQGMIIKTYGLMGVSAAISFWLLSFSENHLTQLCLILMLCFILNYLAVAHRSLPQAKMSELKKTS